ncbi:MAG TPA: hypothetical protein VER33_03300, partial [Polyangiaceae bacterium]|nr:hypothetical protein [Polyangiaceae bacterium]
FPRPIALPARSGCRRALLLLPLAALAALSCGDGSSDDPAVVAGVGATPGSAGAGGGTGGRIAGGVGGRSGAGASGLGGSQGGAARGGAPVQSEAGSAGDDGASAGGPGGDSVPGPGPDGRSSYAIECRGDSLDFKDAALRCLGLRDGNTVLGYGCSNECQSAADCSSAPSGAEATAGCVDFAFSKHCVLVCQQGATLRACPTGMSCYVYPGTDLGYCLWR